jgi:molybdopterin molybdotransferase
MPELFDVHTPPEAWRTFGALFRPVVRAERIATIDALDRIVAEQLSAPHDLPAFPRSTVDGYAVAARDTYGASPGLPAYFEVVGEVPMGRAAAIALDEGQCALVHTGGMIPDDADAVVMVEHTGVVGSRESGAWRAEGGPLQATPSGVFGKGESEEREGAFLETSQPAGFTSHSIEVYRPVATGQNVIQVGEDVRRGDVVLPAGHKIRPQDIGGLLALGITRVAAAASPRVAILSQGDEVVPPDEDPAPGQIRDINSYTLAALTRQAGGTPLTYPILPDRLEALQAAAAAALAEADILVMSAGSSVSVRDLTAQVIQGLGKPGVLVHGVSVKPGKPTILAICDGKPVFGLPGNPVSAIVIFDLFVAATIRLLLGAHSPKKTRVAARLARNIASTTGREDFMQVRLEDRNGEPWAVPVFGKSNLIYTLIRSEGVLRIPLDSNGIAQGEWVTVEM